ncbi:MAG TPA: MoaD/ThiS family protein [Rhodanobacteraceae bacterium]|nr:MoaD/ThiS family protein [Rhodanobacteraceae bacterium]HET9836395.1 MoaD/ThiS family protein [Rhodanobacteraceae bacterium]
MKYRLLYFASLCDAAGRAEETIASDAGDVRALYAELAARHGFTFTPDRLRVAVNGAFTDWNHRLADNDEVVFLPPVSGG